MAMTAHSIGIWSRVHTATSLFCTLFLLITCITGLPLIFHDEIDASSREQHRPLAAVISNVAPMSLDAVVDAGKQLYPASFVQFIFWDRDAPGLVGLGIADTADAELADIHRVLVDPVTGQQHHEQSRETPVMQFIEDLHTSLLVGLIGKLFLSLVALAFLAALVSGIVLYAPFMRTLSFGVVRHDKSRQLKWLDLHNLLSIATAAWAVVVGATGLMNTLEAPLFGAWQAQTMPALLAPHQGKPYPQQLSSLQGAVDTARHALPDMTPTSVGFPYSKFGSPRHYLIWLHGDTPLTAHFFTTVLVDAETGSLAAVNPLPWYLRALEISRPLHFGDYGGWPFKVLWAVFDLITIVVLTSGLYLWCKRKRRAS
jgi:uncharacterized iron-regulated membrane protein